jgi:hypothetical protein
MPTIAASSPQLALTTNITFIMQLRHDLSCCIGNLQRLAVKHREHIDQVQQVWTDARASHFFTTELPPVDEAVKRMIAYLQKTIEFAEVAAAQIRDELPEE